MNTTVNTNSTTPPTTTITSTTGTGTTATGNAAGSSSTSQAISGLNSNYQDFLKLLTTQLQNQDPTAPADTNQITQEIASLSTVEQQINTNSNLQHLISLFSASQVNNAVSYIGKQVDTTGNQGELNNGKAPFVYTLPTAAASATVIIKDSTGATVFSGDGTTLAGRNEVIWDGTNSTTGAIMPNGTYKITVTAKDSTGAAITPTTYTTGIVTSVDTQNGTTTLSLGDISVPLSSVQSVRTAGA